jgi:hypothetical protein
MEILTSDRRAKSRLSILLRELGYSARFHETVVSLQEALRESPVGQSVLIDLDFEADHLTLVAGVDAEVAQSLVGFQLIEASFGAEISDNARHYPSSVMLPPHSERAKSRLRSAIKARSSLSSSRVGTSKNAFTKRFKTKPPFPLAGKIGRQEAKPQKEPTRYLTCSSEAALNLLQKIRSIATSGHHVHVLLGEDGAEFELVCREINYQLHDEADALQVIAPEDFSIEELEKLERLAARERRRRHVYVGRSDEFSADALREFSLFADYLGNLRNPHLNLYLAHAAGTGEFFSEGVAELFRPLCDRLDPIRVPRMGDRSEDIAGICHATIGLLRAAHPFLNVRGINNEAITYLVETRAELNHQKLVRIIRNSTALCQRTVLGVAEVKSYGESEISSQHLLESMADEAFFPAEETVNF